VAGRREQLAREVRARLRQQAELKWMVTPDWASPGEITILMASGADRAALLAVTKAVYLAALAAHAPAVIKAGQGGASWASFQDCLHERGPFAPGEAEKRAAEWQRQQAAKKASRTPLLEGLLDPDASDLDSRSTPTSPEADRHLAEQQRLNRIANSVETRWF